MLVIIDVDYLYGEVMLGWSILALRRARRSWGSLWSTLEAEASVGRRALHRTEDQEVEGGQQIVLGTMIQCGLKIELREGCQRGESFIRRLP